MNLNNKLQKVAKTLTARGVAYEVQPRVALGVQYVGDMINESPFIRILNDVANKEIVVNVNTDTIIIKEAVTVDTKKSEQDFKKLDTEWSKCRLLQNELRLTTMVGYDSLDATYDMAVSLHDTYKEGILRVLADAKRKRKKR